MKVDFVYFIYGWKEMYALKGMAYINHKKDKEINIFLTENKDIINYICKSEFLILIGG